MFFFIGINQVLPQTPEQQYQKALIKEEGEGNLPEAIEIFTKVAENSAAGIALQAKALLHVGLCYEKLGKEEATKAYQNLVNKFPSQKNEVAVARERLSKLLPQANEELKIPLTPKFTKIRTPFNIPQWSGSQLSPNGKVLAFGSGGNIWTVPIPGNVDSNLAGEPKRLEGGSDVLGQGLSWSGDGKWLAFSRAYINDLRSGGTYIKFRTEGAHIDVIPSTGGDPKRIQIPQWVDTNGETRIQVSLSPDGKMVAFDSDGQIFIASVETGTIRQVTKAGGACPRFSPDGTKIAYKVPKGFQENPPSTLCEVWIISPDGTDAVKVSGDVNKNLNSWNGPTWSPDGKNIAFYRIDDSEEKISSKICIIPLSNQYKPLSSPIQIELPVTSQGSITGWTPDNKIGLLLTSEYHEYVYTVSVDGGKATQVSPIDELASIPCWSPDGEKIFFRWKGGGISSVPSYGDEVSVHSALEQVRNETGLYAIYPGMGNKISPNGKMIVFSAGTAKEGPNIYTIPVKGGALRQISSKGRYPCWSPDGKWIAYLAYENVDEETDIVTIFKIPAEGGESQKITSASDNVTAGGFDWSPDGKTIAYFSKKEDTSAGTLNVVSVTEGQSREVCRIENIIAHNNISWSPNGQKIAFTSSGKIWVVSANGGVPTEVKVDVDAWVGMLDWSPDGKKIAFSGESGMKPELWFMEDFLPLEKLAQKEKVKEPDGIQIRQIWKAPYLDDLGTVSLDGKYRSYVDWGVGDLAIHNLQTDEKKVLTDDANLGEEWQYAGSTALSKDGKKIAYSWAKPYNTNELRLINVKNPEPELLYKKTGEELYPVAWLSDREIVAYRSIPDNREMQLVTFNLSEKDIKVKKSFQPGQFGDGLACSPDGKYIAYGFVNEAENGKFDIRLLQVDGNIDIPFITHPSNDKVLGWVPGKEEFLFISDRSGSWDLWAVALDGTKPLGQAKRIYPDIGEVSPMGFTGDGKCYFGFSRRNYYSGIAPLNTETGKIDLESGQSFDSQKFGITWSPDGQKLAYIKIEDGSTGNPLKLFVQDIRTGEEYQPENNILRIASFKWSPDGNSILAVGREINKLQEKDYKGGIFKIDIKTGKIDRVLLLSEYEFNRPEDDSAPLSCVEWSPDKRNFFYLFQKDRLVKHNLETGEDKIIYKYSDFSPYILETSPDGKNLLIGLENPGEGKSRLVTIPIEGGKEETICTAQEANSIDWAKYSPDGEYIYFVELPEFDKSVLWRLPIGGGKPEKIWSPGKRIEIYDIHPNGNSVAFSIYERTTEVRVIENLIQELDKIYSMKE